MKLVSGLLLITLVSLASLAQGKEKEKKNEDEKEPSQILLISADSTHVTTGIVGDFCPQMDKDGIYPRIPWRAPPGLKNTDGCAPWKLSDEQKLKLKSQSFVAVIERGNCSFVTKAANARSAGASLVLIVSNDEEAARMTGDEKEIKRAGGREKIPTTVLVSRSEGTELLSHSRHIREHECSVSQSASQECLNSEFTGVLTLRVFVPSYYDPMCLIVISLAVGVIAAGSFYSRHLHGWKPRIRGGDKSSMSKVDQNPDIDVSLITTRHAACFVVMSSVMLLVLFYFAEYLFLVIVTLFSIGSAFCLAQLITDLAFYLDPKSVIHTLTVVLYTPYSTKYTLSELLGFSVGFLVSSWWLFNRTEYGSWFIQDLLCISLLISIQPTISIPNLKVASILLGSAFFYDIFWVFLSPLFFEQSVMLSVATYNHGAKNDTLPAVLKFPKLDDPLNGFMVLGLGDVALPGLLLTQLLKYDTVFGGDYFTVALFGYGIGLGLTYLNMIIMQQGQPALLFLVPCTLGVVSVLAWRRGQYWNMWSMSEAERKFSGKSDEDGPVYRDDSDDEQIQLITMGKGRMDGNETANSRANDGDDDEDSDTNLFTIGDPDEDD